jgi:hypothetical protein
MDIGEEEEVIEINPGISVPQEWPEEVPEEPNYAPITEPEAEPVPA